MTWKFENWEPAVPTPGQQDPFAPDPSVFPPAPDWLGPAVWIMLAIAVTVVLILIYGWYKSIQVSKAERAALPQREWVDLSKLEKGGRWRDESDQPLAQPREDADGDGTEKSRE